MSKVSGFPRVSVCLMLLTGLIFQSLIIRAAGMPRAAGEGYIRHVRTFEMHELGLEHPGGLAFSPDSDTIFVSESLPTGETRIITITPHNRLLASSNMAVSASDLANLAFDSRTGHLLLSADLGELLGITPRTDGSLDTSPGRIAHFPLGALHLQRLRGMSIDPATGELFFLDLAPERIVSIRPDAQGSYDATQALAEGRVTIVDLKPLGLRNPHGLAYHSGNDHLYLLDQVGPTLYELDQAGAALAVYDLSPFGLVAPQALVIGSSADVTDDPAQMSLYIADPGIQGPGVTASIEPADAAADTAAKVERRGSIVEFSLTPLPVAPSAPSTQATLVRTTDTSQWDTPATDPTGIAYDSGSNTLLISDSEIEEAPAPYFQGKNVWRVNLSGSVVSTWATTSFSSDEPTGVAHNLVNGHVFYSDDDWQRIWEVNPGADGNHGTADDSVTWFNTAAFNCVDPEGVSYDNMQGHLFVADGVGAEVWEVAPGPNGVFDGAAPAGDDVITHFDTTILGLVDPESVEFDPDNGHLYVLSTRGNVIETTRAGDLIQTISLSAAMPKAIAGLAYAPASGDPSQRNFYIVDRGVDNGANIYENDGKIYEMVFPGVLAPTGTPTATNTPTATPTLTNTPTWTPTVTATPRNTGYMNPSANSAVTSGSGDNNGFQTNPGNAYTSNNAYAVDTNSGTTISALPTDVGKDRHLFYGYNFVLPEGATVLGIEVRLEAKADSSAGSPKMYAELSPDGGSSWTTVKSTTALKKTDQVYVLGSASDTWGRMWTDYEFDNTIFRVRITNVATNISRDFSLDQIAVRVTYLP